MKEICGFSLKISLLLAHHRFDGVKRGVESPKREGEL